MESLHSDITILFYFNLNGPVAQFGRAPDFYSLKQSGGCGFKTFFEECEYHSLRNVNIPSGPF